MSGASYVVVSGGDVSTSPDCTRGPMNDSHDSARRADLPQPALGTSSGCRECLRRIRRRRRTLSRNCLSCAEHIAHIDGIQADLAEFAIDVVDMGWTSAEAVAACVDIGVFESMLLWSSLADADPKRRLRAKVCRLCAQVWPILGRNRSTSIPTRPRGPNLADARPHVAIYCVLQTHPWCECVEAIAKVPRWDSALVTSWWRWAGHFARLVERDSSRVLSHILSWRDAVYPIRQQAASGAAQWVHFRADGRTQFRRCATCIPGSHAMATSCTGQAGVAAARGILRTEALTPT